MIKTLRTPVNSLLKRQGKSQKEYQNQIETSGGTYIIAKDYCQFVRWYSRFFKGGEK